MARVVLSEADHDRVSAAVAAAEAGTSGEIVTIVAARSDRYTDIAWAWAVGVMLLALACIAAWPVLLTCALNLLHGGWEEAWTHERLLPWLLVVLALKFLVARLVLTWLPLRDWLTPGRVKTARVRDRALLLFRASAERRTRGRTGILIYLSLAEHRAEIVADQAIHSTVEPEAWGEAMAALIDAVREGRTGDGMAAAVERVGVILHQHLPRTDDDTNELPDRLIEL